MLPPKFLATISIVLFLVEQCLNSPVYTMQPAFITANIGTSGRNIRHLPCVSRRSGQSGVCMFAIDCLKSNGTHLGTCIDRFYFGSCCHIEPGHDINDNVISDSALPHDRHPPYRLSSTTTSTNFSTSTSSTTEKMISKYTSDSIIEHRSTSKLPDIVTEQTVTTRKAEITKPLSATNSITSTTQPPQVSITEVANVSTTILKVSSSATKQAPSSTEHINKIVKTTTESYKISTFQSVDDAETTTTTTTTKPKTTKPVKATTSKPTITTIKVQTKPRPRPTSKPISSTKPGLTRPTTRPTTRATVKPTRSTVRPSTRPPTKIPIKVSAKPITKPSTITKPSNTTRTPTRPITSTSIRPTTPKPIKTTIRATPKPTTQKIITTTKLTTTTTTTKTPSTATPSTTTPSTTTSTKTTPTTIKTTLSTTTTEIVPPIKQAEISTQSAQKPETASPIISNDILISTTKLPSSETVNGNTATNEIEPVVKPTPEKKPDLALITTERTTSQMPAFITWAMVNNEQTTKEPMNNTEETEEWSPITPPDGWVLLPSVTTTPEPETISTSPSTTSTTLPPTFSTFSSFSSFETSSTQSPITLTTSSLTSFPSSLPSSMSTEIPPLTELLSSSTTSVEAEKISETPEVSQSTGVTEKMNVTMELVPLVNVNGTTEEIMQQTTSSMMSSTETMDSTPSPVNMSDFTDVCGRRMFPEPRIVGGEKSSFGKWPWQISLRQWKTSTYLHKCGAALLNENWAITAAHCVDNVPPSDLLLRLGEHDLSTDAEPYIHQERRVQIVASHPQFDPRTFEYDLALLRFYEPVQFQPNIIPVCVPQNDETFVGRSAFVTGWGRLYEDGPLPSILQEVSVPVINNTVCEAMYRNAGYIEHIPNIFICAGWKHGGYDSCEGDSGGPMVIQRPDKRFLLAGIISWGIGCAEPNQPGVYTRISEFRDWINQILQF